MGKQQPTAKPPPASYRDELDDGASTSSAVRLSDIEYPEEETPLRETFPQDELPPYSDVAPTSSPNESPISYLVPPRVTEGTSSSDQRTTITQYPLYSQSAESLESMIRQQANYPPNFALRLKGTHTQTFQSRDGKKETKTITDFDIRLNMTHLLVCPNPGHARDPAPCTVSSNPLPPHDPPQEQATPTCKYIRILTPEQSGYRGTIMKEVDASSDPEFQPSLRTWCEAYISDPHALKNFVLRREIAHHDAARVENLCRNLIDSTSYRGHTSITFEKTCDKIIVTSPARINKWRYNQWIAWACYLTFLWIFTWPFLFFSTKRYEVVTAVFPYRTDPEKSRAPKALVQDEDTFFSEWRESLLRAVVGQHQGWIDAIYREETLQMVRRGDNRVIVQSTGNNIGGFCVSAVSLALGMPIRTGWGADS